MRTLFIVLFWVGCVACLLGVALLLGGEVLGPLADGGLARHVGQAFLAGGGLALASFVGLVCAPSARTPALATARFATRVFRDETPLAILLSLATFVIGITTCSTVASGSDAYGYVSQADLWLDGQLRLAQPWVRQVPWDTRAWSFTPLGYRPIGQGDAVGTIVPTYSPGLPMLMAAARAIGGIYSMFAIVPLAGGLLVLVTYLIGRRLGMARAGLIGAFLVASSPAFLFMVGWPMTDVPVAAGWAWAFFLALSPTRRGAFSAGVVAAVSILIRPNLFYEAVVIGSLCLLRAVRSRTNWRAELSNLSFYALGLAPGLALLALLNHRVYGSVFASSYGSLSGYFSLAHVIPNLKLYPAWFAETQTPLAFLGVLALLVPHRRLWHQVADRSVFVVMGAFVAGIIAMYLVFLPFDAWWYLRYLLGVWPFVMLGMGAFASALWERWGTWVRVPTAAAVIGLVVHGYLLGADRGAFNNWRGEGRYISVARIARARSVPNSVILSMQHSGSLREYSGRMTLRYDYLPGDGLDQALTWLAARGVTAYLLLEEWELPRFRQLFHGQKVLERLDTPLVTYRGPATIHFYDLSIAPPATAEPQVIVENYENLRFVEPGPRPTLALGP